MEKNGRIGLLWGVTAFFFWKSLCMHSSSISSYYYDSAGHGELCEPSIFKNKLETQTGEQTNMSEQSKRIPLMPP